MREFVWKMVGKGVKFLWCAGGERRGHPPYTHTAAVTATFSLTWPPQLSYSSTQDVGVGVRVCMCAREFQTQV